MDNATSMPLSISADRMTSARSPHATLTHAGQFAQIDLRARGDARSRVASALGVQHLPAPNRSARARHGDCLWLGPEEWLLVAPADQRLMLESTMAAAIGPDDGAAIDVSAGRCVLELAGLDAREVLASCCALDLHQRTFAPDHCAQTLVARAPVLIHQIDAAPTYRIFVPPSLADYVGAWLVDGIDSLDTLGDPGEQVRGLDG
jgi:sarcosine oxidase subunit gamma